MLKKWTLVVQVVGIPVFRRREEEDMEHEIATGVVWEFVVIAM